MYEVKTDQDRVLASVEVHLKSIFHVSQTLIWFIGTKQSFLQTSGACVWRRVREKSLPPGFWPGCDPHPACWAGQPFPRQHLLHHHGHYSRHWPTAALPRQARLFPLPPVPLPGGHHVDPLKPWRFWAPEAALSTGFLQPAPPVGGSAVEVLPIRSPASQEAGAHRLWSLQNPEDLWGYSRTCQGAPGEQLWYEAYSELWQHIVGP